MRFFDLDHAWGSQCQASDVTRVYYPKNGVRVDRCGGYATRGVVWQGMVEGEHSLLVCDRHALQRAQEAMEGRYADR